MRRPLAPCPQNEMGGERVARVCRRGDGRRAVQYLAIANRREHDTNEKATLAAARAAFTRIQSASNALPSMTDAHKFNSEAADRRRQMAPSGCACKQCGVVSNHTPKHFQQMECLCDDCYTAHLCELE